MQAVLQAAKPTSAPDRGHDAAEGWCRWASLRRRMDPQANRRAWPAQSLEVRQAASSEPPYPENLPSGPSLGRAEVAPSEAEPIEVPERGREASQSRTKEPQVAVARQETSPSVHMSDTGR